MADASSTPDRPKLGRRPPAIRIESMWVEPVSEWTPASIRIALNEHEGGRFYTSACLADAVLRDPVIMRGVRTRTRALASRSALPFNVEAGAGDGRKRETVRKRIEDLWWTTTNEAVLSAILRDAIMLGFALGRIDWERKATEWIPRLCHLPAHGLSWQPWDRRWIYQTDDGRQLEVTPGDGTWFLHLPHGDRSWMMGNVRCIGLKWLMREDGWIHWARADERHCSPPLKVKEPHFAADDVEGTEGASGSKATAFYRSNFRVGANMAIRLPQGPTKDEGGWDAEWLELVGKPWEGTQGLVDALATEFDVALLGTDTNGDAKGGDGELAAEGMKADDLSSDAETLSTSLREQVWKPFVAFNYSPDDLELAAWGRWTTRPPANIQTRAETLDKAGDAMGKLATLGVDCRPVAAEFGLFAPSGVKAPELPPVTTPTDAPQNAEQQTEK